MPGNGDLGLHGFLLAIVSVPVLAFYFRYKWRHAQSRKQEIRRLLFLAAQESAQAELEDRLQYTYTYSSPFLSSSDIDYSYSYSSRDPSSEAQPLSSVPDGNTVPGIVQKQYCAVCYSPTTTRCARCKAVRYCSGRCQIIHWRKGHKDECSPPSTTFNSKIEADNCSNENLRPNGSRSVNAYEGKEKDSGVGFVKSPPEVHGSSVDDRYKIVNGDTEIPETSPERTNTAIHPDTASSQVSSPEYTVSSRIATDDYGFVDPVLVSVSRFEGQTDVQDAMGSQIPEQFTFPNDETEARGSSSHPDGATSIPGSLNNMSSIHLPRNRITHVGIPTQQVSTGSCSTSSYVSSEERVISDTSSDEVVEVIPSPHSFQTSNHSDFVKSGSRSESDSSGSPLRSLNNIISDQSPLLVPQSYPTSESHSNGYMRTKHRTRGTDVNVSTSMKKPIEEQVISMPPIVKGQGNSIPFSSVNASEDVLEKPNHMRTPSTLSSPDNMSCPDRGHSASRMSHEVNNTLDSVTNPGSHITSTLKTSMRKVAQQFRPTKLSKINSPGYGNETAVKLSKVVFPYDLFVKLYNEKGDLHPFGLENCGNSCYANAVLQCLVFTPPLTSFLLQRLHTKQCKRAEWCFTCELEKLVSQSREIKLSLSPITILSKVHSIGSNLGCGKEEDAHEFLRYVIDTMQHSEARRYASDSFIEEKTLLQLTFGGYLRSNIKCLKCNFKSAKYERMMDLTLGIDGDIRTLEEALKQFASHETLDDNNKYFCVSCNSYVKAQKRLMVYDAPNVLTIVLKRFQSGKFGKINKAVRFPEELDLTPYMCGQKEKSDAYKLYAVVEHLDVMNASFSGHYVCYVKNKHDKWFKINDSKVKPVEPERVLTKAAYMLLYARPSPRPQKLVNCYARVVPQEMLKRSSSTPRPTDPHENHPGRAVQRDDGTMRSESFGLYENHQSLHRVFADSSSDSSSLLSCSDEASCSTESTRDSTSTDDYSEYIFGDHGHWGFNSPTCLYEGSGRCSPSVARDQVSHHRPSLSSFRDSSSPMKVNYAGFSKTGRKQWTRNECPLFLYSDHTNVCSKMVDSSSKRTTCINSEVLGHAYSNEARRDVHTRWS